ncbi:hypothetical protein KY332_03215 [Candidatus Woesearchaeota archaeon]|nr:hypothetical protein [Candidatus Woesearchaeota archaeon]
MEYNIFKKIHLIKNFPESYPFRKKILANILYSLTSVIIVPRSTLLTKQDMIQTRLKIRKGDILLAGNFRESFYLLFRRPLTHAAIYAGNRKFIHAVGDGVCYTSFKYFFTHYDTIAILRLPKRTKHKHKITNKVVKYAKQQINKPYDYEFTKGTDKFFCSDLVNTAFRSAGHKTGVHTFHKSHKKRNFFSVLYPVDFIRGRFRVVFLSHNLELNRKSLVFKKK